MQQMSDNMKVTKVFKRGKAVIIRGRTKPRQRTDQTLGVYQNAEHALRLVDEHGLSEAREQVEKLNATTD